MKRLFRENFVKKEKKETTSNKRREMPILDFDKLTPDNQGCKRLERPYSVNSLSKRGHGAFHDVYAQCD